METFADQHFIDLWRAIGITFNEKKGFDHWADKIVGNGQFLSRLIADSRRGAFVWDMARGMELWLYVTLPPGAQDMEPDDVEVTYMQPGYRGEVRCGVDIRDYREDGDIPGQWWATVGIPENALAPVVMPVVNFLEHAEDIQQGQRKESIVSGLVMQARKSPEGLEDHENLRLLAQRPARRLTPQQRRIMMAKSPWLLLEAEAGAPVLLRGQVRDVSQTANFHTGMPLLKVTLDLPGLVVNLMGPKDSFPDDIAASMTLDVTATLQLFV